MENDPNQKPPDPIQPPEAPKQNKSPLLPLLLGFTPSIIVLAIVGTAKNGGIFDSTQGLFMWLGCFITIICCLVSSMMLFRRDTKSAAVGAVLLFFLNGFIAFFLGCGAMLTGMKF
jgi:uncharacterized membrane protein